MFRIFTAARSQLSFSKIKSFKISARNYLPRPTQKKRVSFFRFLEPPSVEDLYKWNVVPNGFKPVFINKRVKTLLFGYWTSVFVVGLNFYIAFGAFAPDHTSEKKFLEHCVIFIFLLGYFIWMHFVTVRSTKYIFRKDNKFISVFYGSLGPFRDKWVNHEMHEYLPLKGSFYVTHRLKNKRIILNSGLFLNERDYFDLCSVDK